MLRPKKFIPSLAIAMMALSGCGDDGGGGDGGAAGDGGTGGGGAAGGEGGGNGGARNVCTDPDEAVEAFCRTFETICSPGGTQEDVDECVAYTNYDLEPLRLDEPECVEALTTYFCCISNQDCEDIRVEVGCDDEATEFYDTCVPEVSITI